MQMNDMVVVDGTSDAKTCVFFICTNEKLF